MWRQRLWPCCARWQQDQTKWGTTTTESIPYCGRQHCGCGLKQGVLNNVLNFKHVFTAHFQWLSNITQVGVSTSPPTLANGVSAVAWAFCFCLTKGDLFKKNKMLSWLKKKRKRNYTSLFKNAICRLSPVCRKPPYPTAQWSFSYSLKNVGTQRGKVLSVR